VSILTLEIRQLPIRYVPIGIHYTHIDVSRCLIVVTEVVHQFVVITYAMIICVTLVDVIVELSLIHCSPILKYQFDFPRWKAQTGLWTQVKCPMCPFIGHYVL
jgi:hypothetical protein